MSAIQTAAANTVLRIANLFEQNCALKHGLPKYGGPDRVGDEPPNNTESVNISRTETTTATTVTESPSPGEGAAAVSSTGPSPLWRRAAPFIATAAIGAGVPLLTLLRPTDRNVPPAPIPNVQPAEQVRDGDLLQWLQSQGKHLPEGAWQTK